MKKFSKRLFTSLVAFCMLFFVSAVPAFAAETTTEITDTQQPVVIGKMKRLLAICVCFFMCVGLCSCDSSQTRSVSSYNWSLEFITDLDGNMLFSGSVHDDIPVLDLTLSFEEKSFILTDNTHKQEWTGTYSLEKIDNSSSKLGLTFENLEEPVTGVYGTRVYSDDSESATITLQTDENILSFVGEDS